MEADGERSLPGTTQPKWMRRSTDRYGYEDICASPPTNPDGFFHMKKFRQERPSADQSGSSDSGNCFQKRREVGGGGGALSAAAQVQVQVEKRASNMENLSKALADMEKASWMGKSQLLGGFQLHRYLSDTDCSMTNHSAEEGGNGPEGSHSITMGLHKTVSTSSLLSQGASTVGPMTTTTTSNVRRPETSLPATPTTERRRILPLQPEAEVISCEKQGNTIVVAEVDPIAHPIAPAPEPGKKVSSAMLGGGGTELLPAAARNPPSVIVTKPYDVGQDDAGGGGGGGGGGGILSLIEKSLMRRQSKSAPCTPTTTPYSTPAVTPTSSPQMGRRAGNPFFTGGSSNSSGGGSWLFRPAQPESSGNSERGNLFYESKVEVQVNPATKTVNKNVRYVPRPSELRELNFWSPTSM